MADIREITTTQERTGTTLIAGSKTSSYSWDNITDIQLELYCRPNLIKFHATNIAPNTYFHFYFDGKDMTSSVIDSINGVKGSLLSSVTGEIFGEFQIPANTFFVGEKEVIVSTATSYEQVGTDIDWCYAKGSYFAGGLNTTKQTVNLQFKIPTATIQTTTETRTLTETIYPPPPPPPTTTPRPTTTTPRPTTTNPRPTTTKFNFSIFQSTEVFGRPDPIAQTFTPYDDCFLTSIDLFFAEADLNNKNFFVSIMTTENGFPKEELMRTNYSVDIVKISPDASIPTNLKFDFPVYVQKDTEYAVVIGGMSPNTRVYISHLGDMQIENPEQQITTQPDNGVLMTSRLLQVWNVNQLDDLKYTLYAKRLKHSDMTLKFEIQNDRELLPENPFECEIDNDIIRVHYPDHGLSVGDSFIIDMMENKEFILVPDDPNNPPAVGDLLYSQHGYATITNISLDNNNNIVATFSNTVGYFSIGETYTTQTILIYGKDNSPLTKNVPKTGKIIGGPLTSIAGIPIDQLVGKHIVIGVDSPDSILFKIDSTKKPSLTGRFGGSNIYIHANSKFEIFNFSGHYMLYNGAENWTFQGIGHNPQINGNLQKNEYKLMPEFNFKPNTDVYLNYPMKIVDDSNLDKLGTAHNSLITGKLTAFNEFIGPMLQLDSFSFTAISQKISWITKDIFDVSPNKGNRFIPEEKYDGSECYKYVTKQINLQKPARDLKIMVDVFKDVDSDFDIYYKTVNVNQNANIDNLDWIKINIDNKVNNDNLNEKTEYDLLLSDILGDYLTPFISFKIKIVGKAKNTAKPPIFSNLRIIALT